VADRTSPRSTRRRRPHVQYARKHNGFARSLHAFNRAVDEHFPLTPYRDSLGRNRRAGDGPRARALWVIKTLLELQVRARSGIVYVGYTSLGRAFGRSRSTAYRGVHDLVEAGLLKRQSGGGKTYDEAGRLVDAANGYAVPDELLGPEVRTARRRALGRTPAAEVSPASEDLAEYGREILRRHRHRFRETRAGPAA
jgi:hypothetical protein